MNDTDSSQPVQIYISNISEDVWSFINAMAPESRTNEIEENELISDRELFSCADHSASYFILPKPVSQAFLNYYKEMFQLDDVEVMTPSVHTGEICIDTLKDPVLMDRIATLGQTRPIKLIAYSSTFQFLRLINAIEKKGVTVLTPESPLRDRYWTTNFFGSKTGLRQLLWRLPDSTKNMQLPEGYITFGKKDIASIAAHTYSETSAAVIKTAKGHAGAGVMIIPPDSLTEDFNENRKLIIKKLGNEPYWDRFPTTVEHFVHIDNQVGGGNPNVELRVEENGEVTVLYSCGMRVTDEGVFKGVEIHEHALPESLVNTMIETGKVIGKEFAASGYRGYFDVDCVVDKDGTPYIVESNVRRTGGTHVYHLLKTLIGPNFMREVYTVSTNIWTLPGNKPIEFPKLLQLLSPILYNREKKEGVIIISANLLRRHQCGYVVVGKDKQTTLSIEAEMEHILTTHND